jgi:hypothetical protein
MIRVDVEGRGWQTLGADRHRGAYPQSPAPTWDAWGPAALNFTIPRDPSLPHPDLAAYTPIEYLPFEGSEPTWGGYIKNTPAAGKNALSVAAVGWQGATDDDPYTDSYVHEALADWQDIRSIPGAYLYDGTGGWVAAGTVQTGAGEITLAWPQGTIVKAAGGIGVYIDLGPLSRGAKAVSFDCSVPQTWSMGTQVYARGSNSPASPFLGGTYEDGGGPWNLPAAGSPATFTAVYTGTYRYVGVFIYSAGGGTPGSEHTLKISGIRVFTDDSYRSAGASILKASQVLTRGLTRVPALDQSTDLITPSTFSIRAYGGLRQERTFRQEAEAVNAYHRWLIRVRADRKVEFRPRVDTPTLEANTRRAGIDWEDATVNSGDDVYSSVTVRGRSGSGAELSYTLTSAQLGIRNVLDRRGRTRSKILDVQAPTDITAMAVIASAFMFRYGRTPLRGTLVITGDALHELIGRPIPASQVGPRTGEAILLSNLMDPDTGDQGRVALTAGATYSEDTDSTTMAIDNTNDDIEAIFARMGIVSGN